MAEKWDIVIEAGKTEIHYWSDLWRFRELFLFLSWRDILVRYKQTVFGVAWSVIRPVLTMIVFTIIFSKVAKMPSDGVPYPILVYAAMLPWQFFADSFSEASNSLIANANLVTKIYFPRLIVPWTSIVVSLVDFMISFVVLLGLMFWLGYWPTWRMLTLPLFLFLSIIPAFGAGIFISALNVKYRDFRYVIPFIVQFGLYISPVGFSSNVIPQQWRLLYSLNPMVGVIDGFRWAILGKGGNIYLPGFVLSIVISLLLLIIGVWYFRKVEKAFADII